MQYDNSNNHPPAIIKSFNQVSQEDCANNDYANLPQSEALDMGGYAFFNSANFGTASGTSINQQVTFIPREGSIPEVEINLNHLAYQLEIKPELKGAD